MSSNVEDVSSKYDPNLIIQAAQDKLNNNNDLEGGQMMFQSALLSWVDDAREQEHQPTNHSSAAYDTMQQAIVTLWLAYAEFLFSANQNRSAMEAYEQAVNCPVAGSVGTVWLAYAQFAQERDKKRTAQQVYMRALVGENTAIHDEQERDILWQAFLDMMRESNPELTLTDLQEAIAAEQKQKQQSEEPEPNAVPSSILSGGTDSEDIMESVPSAADGGTSSSGGEPASKRMKLEPNAARNETTGVGVLASPPLPSPALQVIHVVSMESVQMEAQAFLEVIQQTEVPQDILAAWMIRDGQGLAEAPEPPLFEPAPPKFSDPTAKDILGLDMALKLNQRLQTTSGSILLKVCQTLWTLTAIMEHQTNETITQLDQSLKQAHEQREANFSARLAMTATTTEAVKLAVQTSINADRQVFQRACQDQRQKLLQDIAWQLRRLLCMQQQVLTRLQVPGFLGPTVDASALQQQAKICSYLHAAFFLRNRIGPEPHVALLEAQSKRLEQQQQQQQTSNTAAQQQQQQQQQQPPPMYLGQQQPPPPPMVYPSYPQQPPPQQQHGYGIPPPPPPPPPPQYPPYAVVPQQQPPPHLMQMQPPPPQPQMLPPHRMPPPQQPPPPPGYPPYNYYPS